jgi:cytochrome c5
MTVHSMRKISFLIGIVLVAIGILSGIYFYVQIQKNVKAVFIANSTVDYFPAYPELNLTNKSKNQAAAIKHGAYLATAGDCIACHTDTFHKGVAFAGGLAVQTPFGVIYTPNITPDKKFGLGNWSYPQFENAMRHGIAPDGSYYYPAFPFNYFHKITDADLKDLYAYFQSIPAYEQKPPADQMMFPFNLRFLQWGWRLFYFNSNTGTFQPDANASEQWNRGAYLVQGLGHCGMCHTPSYHLLGPQIPLAAPIISESYTGAYIQGNLSLNITRVNTHIPVTQFLQVFLEDKGLGGNKISGPMLEVNHDSLRYLSKSDLEAIQIYLSSIETKPQTKKLNPSSEGIAIYNVYCAVCHETGVSNAPKTGHKARWQPLINTGIDKLYLAALYGTTNMPAKGTCIMCREEVIKAAVDYMVLRSQ